jgi:hypothetical protein
MEAAAHGHHDHHEMPTSGSALTSVAFSATLHCLTGRRASTASCSGAACQSHS